MTLNFEEIGDPMLILSHPRSGTHLTIDIIRKNFKAFSSTKNIFEPPHYLYLSIEGFLEKKYHKKLTIDKAYRIVSRPIRPIIKMHTYSYSIIKDTYPDWMDWIEKKGKIIYVIRDVRDVLCSYFVYARQAEKKSSRLISNFIKEGYCGSKNRPTYWNNINLKWVNDNRVMVIKYEDILGDTSNLLQKIGEFIGEEKSALTNPLPAKPKNIWGSRLGWIKKNPASTAILGSIKGQKLNWKEVFSKDDLQFIYQHAGPAMKQLGYLKGR